MNINIDTSNIDLVHNPDILVLSQKPSPATTTTSFRPSWGTRNELL